MLSLFPRVVSSAVISDCGRYRYSLLRVWSELPRVCWIMLNPSTADAHIDDPTIRRCMGFSRAWGAGGIVVVNLFALRATDPDELLSYIRGADPLSAFNDRNIGQCADQRRIIAAWGSHQSIKKSGRDHAVMKLLAGKTIECLGVTKDGYPRHPLYVAGKVAPVEYRGRPDSISPSPTKGQL
jgi:hypothetical protein